MLNIKNGQLSSSQKGFTLAELLISMLALGIFIVLVTGIYFNILKSAMRQNVQTEVKQNGDRALAVILADIRSAQALDDITVCNGSTQFSSITLINQDNSRIIYETASRTSKNGMPIIGFQKTIEPAIGPVETLFLINDTVSLLSTTSNPFRCKYQETSGTQVWVNFDLGIAANLTPVPGRLEETSKINFNGYGVIRTR